MNTLKPVVFLGLLLVGLATAGPTFTFENISNNSAASAAIGEAQLSVELVDLGGGQVKFLFRNTGPDASSITDIYFDDEAFGALSTPLGFTDIVGQVSFAQGASPGNLPGGNSYDFDTSDGLSADSNAQGGGVQPNGVNPGEQLGLTLFGDYDDVLAYLNSGDLQIGLHVQGYANGRSESYINNGSIAPAPVVPVPGAATLTLVGLGSVLISKRRK